MNKKLLQLFTLFFISGLSVSGQTYKCGVTVDNYYLQKDGSDYIRTLCSDRKGNIFYNMFGKVYKNKALFAEYHAASKKYFGFMMGLTTDKEGNLYALDIGNNAVYKVTPAGVVSIVAGIEGKDGSKDTVASKSTISDFSQAICVDSMGTIYVAERTKIRKISNGYVTTFVGRDSAGSVNGVGTEALFDGIDALTCDGQGNLYVVQSNGAYSNTIRKVTPNGTVSNYAGDDATAYYVDDEKAKAGIGYVRGLVYGYDKHLYFADYSGSKVRRISPQGQVTTVAGHKSTYDATYAQGVGPGHLVGINEPIAITQTPDGKVHVVTKTYGSYTSQQYQVIRSITIKDDCEKEVVTVSTICGNGLSNEFIAGNGRAAEFRNINAITKDKAGNLYIAESQTKNVYKMTPDGNVSFFCANHFGNSSASIRALATDADGYVFAAVGDHIQMFNPDGSHKKDFFYNDLDHQFGPTRLVSDGKGNIVFSDMFYHNIRRLNIATGIITTIAGGDYVLRNSNVGYKDGPALQARFDQPIGIDIDAKGNIYIADAHNGRIRKLDTYGMVTTIVGSSYGSADGKGKLAQTGYLSGLKLDQYGSIYYTDAEFKLVKRITFPDTNVVTIAGNVYENKDGMITYIDGKASISRFDDPGDLFVDKNLTVYIVDEYKSVVRAISGLSPAPNGLASPSGFAEGHVLFFPNPATDHLHFREEKKYSITDLNGTVLISGKGVEVDVTNLPAGMYLLQLEGMFKAEKLIKK